ncbi:hypothetical protein [Streptomyces sp. NPDC017260]|uniref:hypothetical protein n=1 Tax=unclassified Streptomyces TaxID=2593676 RepID=UPI0037999806
MLVAQGILDETDAAAQGSDVVLVDRAAHDAVAYFEAAMACRAETPPRLERERLLTLASTQLPDYDLLLATVLDEACPSTPATTTTPASGASSTTWSTVSSRATSCPTSG